MRKEIKQALTKEQQSNMDRAIFLLLPYCMGGSGIKITTGDIKYDGIPIGKWRLVLERINDADV